MNPPIVWLENVLWKLSLDVPGWTVACHYIGSDLTDVVDFNHDTHTDFGSGVPNNLHKRNKARLVFFFLVFSSSYGQLMECFVIPSVVGR